MNGRFVVAALVLLAAAPTSASSALSAAQWPTGNPSCPCINPWDRGLQPNSHAGFVQSSTPCNITRAGDSHCFSDLYGVDACAYHDNMHTPECTRAETPAEWCTAMWCWVDPDKCDLRPHQPSEWFKNATYPSVTVADAFGSGEWHLPPTGLSYSYETCGYINRFGGRGMAPISVLRRQINLRPDKRLRIVFPSESVPYLVDPHIQVALETNGTGGRDDRYPPNTGVQGSVRPLLSILRAHPYLHPSLPSSLSSSCPPPALLLPSLPARPEVPRIGPVLRRTILEAFRSSSTICSPPTG